MNSRTPRSVPQGVDVWFCLFPVNQAAGEPEGAELNRGLGESRCEEFLQVLGV